MQDIFDLVQEKKEEIKKKVLWEMTPEQAQWQRAKEEVKNLKANYEEIIKENLKIRAAFVKKRKLSTGEALEVFLPRIEDFELVLYIAKNKDNIIKVVRYELWNGRAGTVFIRDLLQL